MICTYGALMLLSPFTGSTIATGITAGLLFPPRACWSG
jgi:hypothetical protein